MPTKAHRSRPQVWQASGIASVVLLISLLIGTATGREALAWIYFAATDAIANATHIHTFPLDRFDPTCPHCM